MARPKEFDEREALVKALHVFWRTGYLGTSIQDLTDAMQINRQSLYDTFGDKRELFLAVMEHYTRNEGIRWIRPLFDADVDIQTRLRRTFGNIADEAVHDNQALGCLIVNASVECRSMDTEISDCLNRAMLDTEMCFYNALSLAQEKSEIGPELNPRSLARYFLNAVRGLRIMARSRPERAAMQEIIDLTLSVLK